MYSLDRFGIQLRHQLAFVVEFEIPDFPFLLNLVGFVHLAICRITGFNLKPENVVSEFIFAGAVIGQKFYFILFIVEWVTSLRYKTVTIGAAICFFSRSSRWLLDLCLGFELRNSELWNLISQNSILIKRIPILLVVIGALKQVNLLVIMIFLEHQALKFSLGTRRISVKIIRKRILRRKHVFSFTTQRILLPLITENGRNRLL